MLLESGSGRSVQSVESGLGRNGLVAGARVDCSQSLEGRKSQN